MMKYEISTLENLYSVSGAGRDGPFPEFLRFKQRARPDLIAGGTGRLNVFDRIGHAVSMPRAPFSPDGVPGAGGNRTLGAFALTCRNQINRRKSFIPR